MRNKTTQDASEAMAKVVEMQNTVSRAIAERDEAMNLSAEATRKAEHYRDLANSLSERNKKNLIAIESDINLIGQVIADRMSATAVIGLGNRIMERHSEVSALVTGALVQGYASAKQVKPDVETVTVAVEPDAE